MNYSEFLNIHLSNIEEINNNINEDGEVRIKFRAKARRELNHINTKTTNNQSWDSIRNQIEYNTANELQDRAIKDIEIKINKFNLLFNSSLNQANENSQTELKKTFTHILKFIEWHNNTSSNNTKKTELIIDNPKTSQHPKHNPNLWNNQCFELFKYLFDNYYKGTNRQITNIWFFLKEYDPQHYIKKCTKDVYKDFIKNNYKIKITNFDKAANKYEDTEYNSMNEHRAKFEDSLK